MAGRADYRRGNFSLSEVIGKKLFFLLDLDMGGEILRLSTEEFVGHAGVNDETGVTQLERYYSGLEFDEQVNDPLAFLNDEPDQKSVSVTLHLWPQWDITEFVKRGVIVGASKASLYLWPQGADYRIRILEGRFRNPSWNYREEPLVGSIEEDPVQDTALWPPADNRVLLSAAGGNFLAPGAKALNEYFPTVFGSPGGGIFGPTGVFGIDGSPALYVSDQAVTDRLLIAGHNTIAAINGDTVFVHDVTDGTFDAGAVLTDRDAYGNIYSYIEISSGGSFVADPDHEYWIWWQNLSGERTYGIPADDKTEAQGMRGAGDILIYWLRNSNILWDEGRVNAIRGQLNRYKIDTYAMASADERLSPYSWITDNLIGVLPISPRIGPGGLYFVFWNYDFDRSAAVMDLDTSRDAQQNGSIETSTIDDVVNTLILHYDKDVKNGEFAETLIYTGNPDNYLNETATVVPNLYGRRSYQTYGEERIEEIDLEIIREPATAGLVAAWKIRSTTEQWLETSYLIPKKMAVQLTVGDVVTIKDEERGLVSDLGGVEVGRVAMVTIITISSAEFWDVALRIPSEDFGLAG